MATSLLSIYKCATAELVAPNNEVTNLTEQTKKVSIRKCCKQNEILVEVHIGVEVKVEFSYIIQFAVDL